MITPLPDFRSRDTYKFTSDIVPVLLQMTLYKKENLYQSCNKCCKPVETYRIEKNQKM